MSSAPIPTLPETPLWKRSLAGLMTAWCLLSPTGLVWAGPVADATGSAMAAAGTSATGTAVGAGLGNVMVSGALTSMATSATSQLLTTGKVDAGQMFRAGVTSGLTAGLLNAPVFDSATGGTQSLNQMAGIQDVAATGSRLANFNFDSLGQNLVGIVGRGVVTAGVDSAINGSSFGTAFKQSLVSDLAAVGANAIGQTWGGGKNPFLQTVAHAGLGATAAKLTGKDAVAGAIGGASESVLGNLVDEAGGFDKTSNDNRILYTAGSMLLGGSIAVAAGRDGVTASGTAQNAATNNYLEQKSNSPPRLSEQQQLEAALKSGNTAKVKELMERSTLRDKILANACDAGADACRTEVRAAIDAGNIVMRDSQGRVVAVPADSPFLKATDRPVGFDTQLAPSMLDAMVMQGGGILLKGTGYVFQRMFGAPAGGFLGEGVVTTGAKGGGLSGTRLRQPKERIPVRLFPAHLKWRCQMVSVYGWLEMQLSTSSNWRTERPLISPQRLLDWRHN